MPRMYATIVAVCVCVPARASIVAQWVRGKYVRPVAVGIRGMYVRPVAVGMCAFHIL